MWWIYIIISLVSLVLGLLIGYFYRAKQDRAIAILAAMYKMNADELLERLTEIENSLYDDNDNLNMIQLVNE